MNGKQASKWRKRAFLRSLYSVEVAPCGEERGASRSESDESVSLFCGLVDSNVSQHNAIFKH